MPHKIQLQHVDVIAAHQFVDQGQVVIPDSLMLEVKTGPAVPLISGQMVFRVFLKEAAKPW